MCAQNFLRLAVYFSMSSLRPNSLTNNITKFFEKPSVLSADISSASLYIDHSISNRLILVPGLPLPKMSTISEKCRLQTDKQQTDLDINIPAQAKAMVVIAINLLILL